MIKKLVILGGGTSGLITALVTRAFQPTLDITLIKSSSLGIIGVGEGSTEHWKKFMTVANIPVGQLVAETGATYKYGIKFEDWNGDGKSYIHSVSDSYTGSGLNRILGLYMDLVGQDAPIDKLMPQYTIDGRHSEPLDNSVNQYHFDTFKLNEFLLKLCASRKITIIDNVITDVNLNANGFVESLSTEDGSLVAGDFFIDSSGFKRIISSKLGAKWQSCQEYLPMNSAIAFPTPGTEELPGHTLSKAMSAGWMWQIPTQTRQGNGYVYCDKFISDEDAIKEAQSQYSEKIEVARSFKFDAGYVDKFWIKNCISVGLSGSFVEPLEASSIGTSIQQAFSFAEKIVSWTPEHQQVANVYNDEFTAVLTNIIDFIQLHYVTKRRDTDFWKSCEHLKLTKFNQDTLELFKVTFPTHAFFPLQKGLFRDPNWILVMHGLGMFDTNAVKLLQSQQDPAFISGAREQLSILEQYHPTMQTFSHRETINTILARYQKG